MKYEAAGEATPIANSPEGNAVPNDKNEGPDAENTIQVGGKVVEVHRLGQSGQ